MKNSVQKNVHRSRITLICLLCNPASMSFPVQAYARPACRLDRQLRKSPALPPSFFTFFPHPVEYPFSFPGFRLDLERVEPCADVFRPSLRFAAALRLLLLAGRLWLFRLSPERRSERFGSRPAISTSRRVCRVYRSILPRESRSFWETNEIAIPAAPARPVRPIR